MRSTTLEVKERFEIGHFCKSPLNLLDELFSLLVFLIMWIPSTNTILNVSLDQGVMYRLNITLMSLNVIVLFVMPNTLVALYNTVCE